ncbi:DgyrCDS7132 [Dimorphilus gyrociliatus]|uniref:DgyrCDS7132 n=1 Tax=Dimorphilus gyrociliatus TaxID=2664684 RepID=A0A7I8VRW7_9ANNE|nr:DgyrCDS7132 [Dimorphilus gyrociliatus]
MIVFNDFLKWLSIDLSIKLTISLISLLVAYFLLEKFKGGKRIPGPKGLPLVGIAFSIKKEKMHLELANYARKYGNLCRFNLMGSDIVLVSGLKLIHEVFVTKQDGFSSRYLSNRLGILYKKEPGITAMNDDEKFRELKKICLKSFKHYGDGMETVESLTMRSINKFFTYLSNANGKAVDINDKIQYLLADIVYSMLLNQELSEEEISQITKMSIQFVEVTFGSKALLLELFPWLKYFGYKAYKKICDYERNVCAFWNKVIDQRFLMNQDEKNKDEISGAIDSMYSQLMKSSFQYSRASFCKTLQSIILAGFSTTSSSMYNFLPILLNHPQIEKRIFQEVSEAVGHSRMPCLEDKKNMPYSEACVLELLRYTTVVPFALPHETDRDMDLDGYQLKKGTQVYYIIC